MVRNKQVKLKHHVLAALKETDLEVIRSEITLEFQENSDDVVVKNLYLSCDPYMRIRMTGLDISHTSPFKPGQVNDPSHLIVLIGLRSHASLKLKYSILQTLEGFGVSKVVISSNPKFKVGDYVTSWTKWEEYSVIAKGERLQVVDPSFAPLSYYLGALGKQHCLIYNRWIYLIGLI